MKKQYMIVYTETITHWFYVDAESKEDAEDEFNYQVNEGQIDFSDGEVTDSNIDILEMKEDAQ